MESTYKLHGGKKKKEKTRRREKRKEKNFVRLQPLRLELSPLTLSQLSNTVYQPIVEKRMSDF